jgi:tellurite resistance protein
MLRKFYEFKKRSQKLNAQIKTIDTKYLLTGTVNTTSSVASLNDSISVKTVQHMMQLFKPKKKQKTKPGCIMPICNFSNIALFLHFTS